MDRLTKVVFETGSDKEPYLNVELASFLGYTGLRNRLSLPEDECMFFDREYEDFHYFWMDQVSFPLDLIFVDEFLNIVDIRDSCPPNYQAAYTSRKPARYVIEANGGWCEANNVVIGTSLRFQGIWRPM